MTVHSAVSPDPDHCIKRTTNIYDFLIKISPFNMVIFQSHRSCPRFLAFPAL